jgi:hypothetical protein
VNDYPAMIDQDNRVEPVPQQVRARLADEPTGTAPAAAAVHGQAGPPADGGDLTDELIATDWWTDAMLTAAGIPVIDFPLVIVGGGIGSFVTNRLLADGRRPYGPDQGLVGHRCAVADLIRLSRQTGLV